MPDPPVRTCIGCRSRRRQADLLRLHLDERSRLKIDRNGPGRGAWLCAASPGQCLVQARDRKGLARAFRQRPDEASIEFVAEQLRHE